MSRNHTLQTLHFQRFDRSDFGETGFSCTCQSGSMELSSNRRHTF